jgi:hypothetical protein
MGLIAARRTRPDLRKKEEGRRKKEEGRRKKKGKKEEGRRKKIKRSPFLVSSFYPIFNFPFPIFNSQF